MNKYKNFIFYPSNWDKNKIKEYEDNHKNNKENELKTTTFYPSKWNKEKISNYEENKAYNNNLIDAGNDYQDQKEKDNKTLIVLGVIALMVVLFSGSYLITKQHNDSARQQNIERNIKQDKGALIRITYKSEQNNKNYDVYIKVNNKEQIAQTKATFTQVQANNQRLQINENNNLEFSVAGHDLVSMEILSKNVKLPKHAIVTNIVPQMKSR